MTVSSWTTDPGFKTYQQIQRRGKVKVRKDPQIQRPFHIYILASSSTMNNWTASSLSTSLTDLPIAPAVLSEYTLLGLHNSMVMNGSNITVPTTQAFVSHLHKTSTVNQLQRGSDILGPSLKAPSSWDQP